MDSLKTERKTVKRRRITVAEPAEIFSRVKKPDEYFSEVHSFHSEKILALLANCPKDGAKKLSASLMLEGIFLSPNSIYKLLVKHDLNRSSLRTSWKDGLEET